MVKPGFLRMIKVNDNFEIFNFYLSHLINKQKDLSKPIYLIASYWCGVFNGITGIFSTEGDKDLEEIKKQFQDKYAWKENSFGITEQSYRLIKVDLTTILNWDGKEVKENE